MLKERNTCIFAGLASVRPQRTPPAFEIRSISFSRARWPEMAKVLQGQSLPADVVQLIEQLERHCLAPDGSLVSKSSHSDLQLVFSSSLDPGPFFLSFFLFVCLSLIDLHSLHHCFDFDSRPGRRCPEKEPAIWKPWYSLSFSLFFLISTFRVGFLFFCLISFKPGSVKIEL